MKSQKILSVFAVAVLVLLTSAVPSQGGEPASPAPMTGISSGGGGDHFVADFVRTAYEDVYLWLKDHGRYLNPQIDAEAFRNAVDPTRIASQDVVYESCDGSNKGRMVAACYNDKTDMIYLSRRYYPLDLKNSPTKNTLIMHEIFRRMGLEGDGYEITRTVWAQRVISEEMQDCIVTMVEKTTIGVDGAVPFCQRNGADPRMQNFVITIYEKTTSGIDKAVELAERSHGDERLLKCVVKLYTKTSAGFDKSVRICEGQL